MTESRVGSPHLSVLASGVVGLLGRPDGERKQHSWAPRLRTEAPPGPGAAPPCPAPQDLEETAPRLTPWGQGGAGFS